MPNTNELTIAITLALLVGACTSVDEQDDAAQAPEPIGAELLRSESVFGIEACNRSHLYRDGRRLQYQCFTLAGEFSWENRGTLSPEGAAALDAELAAADLDDTEPGDYMGLCNGSESGAATWTLTVGERSVSYPPSCPTEGLEPLNELLWTLTDDLVDCWAHGLDLLESIDPGCRYY